MYRNRRGLEGFVLGVFFSITLNNLHLENGQTAMVMVNDHLSGKQRLTPFVSESLELIKSLTTVLPPLSSVKITPLIMLARIACGTAYPINQFSGFPSEAMIKKSEVHVLLCTHGEKVPDISAAALPRFMFGHFDFKRESPWNKNVPLLDGEIPAIERIGADEYAEIVESELLRMKNIFFNDQ